MGDTGTKEETRRLRQTVHDFPAPSNHVVKSKWPTGQLLRRHTQIAPHQLRASSDK